MWVAGTVVYKTIGYIRRAHAVRTIDGVTSVKFGYRIFFIIIIIIFVIAHRGDGVFST